MAPRLRSTHGFTLIELLVVVLIIGILIAVAAPSFLGQTQKAHDSATKQNLAVAYRDAKASATDRDGNYTQGAFDVSALAAAIHSDEPQLTVAVADDSDSAHSCPAVASGQADDHIFVDTTGTHGNSIAMCADPDGVVWTLTSVNGGPVVYTSADTTTSSSGGSSSAADNGGNTVAVTGDPNGTATTGTQPVGCALDCTGWTITDSGGTASNPNTITITVQGGGGDAGNITVKKDGTVVPPCNSPGVADPDPCVDSETDTGGDAVIVILTTGDSSATYTTAGPAAPAAPFTGDTPNNAAGAPSNDDFSNAKVLSGNSGTTNGTLTGATVENGQTMPETGPNPSVDNEGWGGAPTASVWYGWQAPASGPYQFDTIGSPAPMFGDGTDSAASVGAPIVTVWEGTKWPDAEYCGSGPDPAMFAMPWCQNDMKISGSVEQVNQENWNTNGDFTRWDTKVFFTATAGTWYAIQVTNATNGCRNNSDGNCPAGSAFKLNWATFQPDSDSDGVPDATDNCPTVPNPNQTDNAGPAGPGGDGIGDICQSYLIVHNNSSYPVELAGSFNPPFSSRTWSTLNSNQSYPSPDSGYPSANTGPCAPGATCVYGNSNAGANNSLFLTGTDGSSTQAGGQQTECTMVYYSDNGPSSRDCSSYSPFAADGPALSHLLRVVSGAGSGQVFNVGEDDGGLISITVTDHATVATSWPSISNTVAPAGVGGTLSVSSGGWSGTGLSETYQWYRCDRAPGNDASYSATPCTAIPGATSQTYVMQAADSGNFLEVEVDGTTSAGSEHVLATVGGNSPGAWSVP